MNADQKHVPTRPVLTIAIPAYNVASYLEDCLKPLVEFAPADLEVIIIDDGSTDKTSKIAKKFAKEYKHITYLSKKNGGHGSAINLGLNRATGHYFKLLDGDDYLDTPCLKKLIDYLKITTSDIVLTDYVEYYMRSGRCTEIENYHILKPEKIYGVHDEKGLFTTKGPLLATTSFRTDIFKSDPFTIDEHCYYVDMEYNFFVYQRAESISYVALPLYYYRLERQGQSMQRLSLMKNYEDHGAVCLRLAKELSVISPDSEKHNYLLEFIVAPLCRSHYQILIEFLKNRSAFLSFDNKLKRFSTLYHSPLVSGKIISIHRATGGMSVTLNASLRKFGGVLKHLATK